LPFKLADRVTEYSTAMGPDRSLRQMSAAVGSASGGYEVPSARNLPLGWRVVVSVPLC